MTGPDAEANPWTTRTTRIAYDNPWLRVREDQVIRPDGQEGIYGVVHFKNRAVGILPVADDGSIWLVGQYRYTLDAYSWEIPEGGCPEGEESEAAAHRELAEETGMIAGRLELISRVHLSNSVTDEQAFVYRASNLAKGSQTPEPTERLQVRLVPWRDAWEMLRSGMITDSISVIALLDEAIRRSERNPR